MAKRERGGTAVGIRKRVVCREAGMWLAERGEGRWRGCLGEGNVEGRRSLRLKVEGERKRRGAAPLVFSGLGQGKGE